MDILPETTSSLILYWAAIILMGIAVFFIAQVIFTEEQEFKASETLEDLDAKNNEKKVDFVLRFSRPFFKRYFTPVVMGMKGFKKRKPIIKRKLATAGLTETLSPEDFFAFKLFGIISFPVVYVAVGAFLQNEGDAPWPLSYIPFLAIIGFAYPNIWMNSKIQLRQKSITIEMPFIVDMLALSVEAGLDTVAAITRVIEKAPPGALKEEFEILIKEIKVGASRMEALRNLSWRCDLIQISSFCATLIAADSVGASIGPILKSLSGEIRQKRSAEIEKKGAQAATKILLPMVFFIIPSVLLVVFGPMAMEFIGRN